MSCDVIARILSVERIEGVDRDHHATDALRPG